MIPLFLELPIYICSVRVAKKMNKTLLYRTLRTRIKTQDDNDLMWSSEEDEVNDQDRIRARATSVAI